MVVTSYGDGCEDWGGFFFFNFFLWWSFSVFTWGIGNRYDENGEDEAEWLLGFEMCGSDFLEFIVFLDLQAQI